MALSQNAQTIFTGDALSLGTGNGGLYVEVATNSLQTSGVEEAGEFYLGDLLGLTVAIDRLRFQFGGYYAD